MQKDRHYPRRREEDVSILFADVIGSRHGERLAPECGGRRERHFDLCSRVVATHDGTLDKYTGDRDGVLERADRVDDHAGKALVAALEMWPFRFHGARRRPPGSGHSAGALRVGVQTGDAWWGWWANGSEELSGR